MLANAQLREMEISTALLTEGDQQCIGFTIHPMAVARTAAAGSSLEQLCNAIGQLTTRIESVQLPELLHAVALLAQQHFVRSALEQVAIDAGAAAILLGVGPEQLHGGAMAAAAQSTSPTGSRPGVSWCLAAWHSVRRTLAMASVN